jgi:very-short-patch-repair endonuclease
MTRLLDAETLAAANERNRKAWRKDGATNAVGLDDADARRRTRTPQDGDAAYPPAPAAPRKPSEIEEKMAEQIWLCKLPEPVRQFQPFPQRKWKIDFAWPRYKLALEVDGMVHRIKATFKSSFERGYWLMRADWRVLHVGGDQVRSGEAVTWIEQLLQAAHDREEARRHR